MLRAVAISPGQISAEGGTIVLGNQGVPMVMPGSGLMVANGVGTLTTALAATPAITSCYAYFALNAIATGVAAGWYYTVFSTTTAFIVYNNTYTSGTPIIPASPTAFVTTSPTSYTGASTAITAYQLSVPGNTLGINGGLRVSSSFSYTNSAATKTMTLSYGTLLLLSFGGTTSATLTAVSSFKNQGVTGLQMSNTLQGATSYTAATNALVSGTVDTTATQTLSSTMTNATPATNNMVQASMTVELLPSVT
jgi:hypothetical protein